ncbi:hypothetical protein ACVH9Z_00765 [Rhodococcus opacus]|uniref:Low molecular weight antigen MTB12-like C-terminal domain-containing protein n=1 Tax=Rhodococcus opacus TaxID=37919 RepID=A0AAX3YCD1_RHOOP|nr:hypothetical protein [Rhodococcus opacus]MCZ4582983.1 hypothetical protein [Rhodococcus opacus]MDJ0412970.1 hypothetical protein [Rhodococcus opacus]WLF45811.1 hypothetical protein Q5707_28560 [Rhodococcus opacus]
MTIRKITVAAVAIAAALTMSACGSDEPSGPSATTTSTTTAAAETSAELELPTAADLNALLAKGLDPATPLEEKIAMVEGSEQDPNLFNQVAAAAQQAGAQVQVLDPVIDNGDGSASAQLQLTINGQVQQNTLPAIFVPGENGTWKLSKATACSIVAIAQLTSPACPPA